jgi:hypothetical protein
VQYVESEEHDQAADVAKARGGDAQRATLFGAGIVLFIFHAVLVLNAHAYLALQVAALCAVLIVLWLPSPLADLLRLEGRWMWVARAIALPSFFISLAGLYTAATYDPEAHAQERGFASMVQMKKMNARGYATMQDFNDAAARSPTFFIRHCWRKSTAVYEEACLGKRVVWGGMIASYGSDGARIEVLNFDGSKPAENVTIDAEDLGDLEKQYGTGRVIQFEGIIGDANMVYPDIEKARLLYIEANEEKAARVSRAKAREQAILSACERQIRSEAIAVTLHKYNREAGGGLFGSTLSEDHSRQLYKTMEQRTEACERQAAARYDAEHE